MASPAASSEGNSSLTVSSSVLKLTVAAEETEREGGKEGGRRHERENMFLLVLPMNKSTLPRNMVSDKIVIQEIYICINKMNTLGRNRM